MPRMPGSTAGARARRELGRQRGEQRGEPDHRAPPPAAPKRTRTEPPRRIVPGAGSCATARPLPETWSAMPRPVSWRAHLLGRAAAEVRQQHAIAEPARLRSARSRRSLAAARCALARAAAAAPRGEAAALGFGGARAAAASARRLRRAPCGARLRRLPGRHPVGARPLGQRQLGLGQDAVARERGGGHAREERRRGRAAGVHEAARLVHHRRDHEARRVGGRGAHEPGLIAVLRVACRPPRSSARCRSCRRRGCRAGRRGGPCPRARPPSRACRARVRATSRRSTRRGAARRGSVLPARRRARGARPTSRGARHSPPLASTAKAFASCIGVDGHALPEGDRGVVDRAPVLPGPQQPGRLVGEAAARRARRSRSARSSA